MNKQQPTDGSTARSNVSPARCAAELPIGATATIIGIHPICGTQEIRVSAWWPAPSC